MAGVVFDFLAIGLIGSLFGIVVFWLLARWSGLIAQRTFAWGGLVLALGAIPAVPLIIASLWSRPEAAAYRVGLLEKGFAAFWQNPLLGAGLNTGTAVLAGGRRVVEGAAGEQAAVFKLHNHYQVVLVEDGLIGFLLFFGFFARIVAMPVGAMHAAQDDRKIVLVATVTALASVAVHNLGDPFQCHVTSAMLWLYAALIVAVVRRGEVENPALVAMAGANPPDRRRQRPAHVRAVRP
jgi:O-antigen ligase